MTDLAASAHRRVPASSLPDLDTPAPVRFPPWFDNASLSHKDRSRIIPPEHAHEPLEPLPDRDEFDAEGQRLLAFAASQRPCPAPMRADDQRASAGKGGGFLEQ